MHFGVLAIANENGLLPAELAREAEDRGLESVWFSDHSHIPARRETPWPGGAELPDNYYAMMDPIVCMAAAAEATTRLRLGTAVILVIERDPIHLAKSIACIDVISKGRVELGVGGGWNFEEMRNHGTDPGQRWQLLRERVEAMKVLWTTDPSEYHGELVNFDPVISRPKPAQPAGPRVHVGGAGQRAYRRALRYGDGWMPLLGRGDDDVVKHIGNLRVEAVAMGRSLDGFEVTMCNPPLERGVLERYAAGGVDRVLLSVPSVGRDAGLRALDRIQAQASQFDH